MLIDLRIHFTGLALFVPDGNTLMHVLLPAAEHLHDDMRGAARQHHHPHAAANVSDIHHARIMYDKAHASPNARQFLRTYVLHDFGKRILEFRGLTQVRGRMQAPELDTSLPVELPAMEHVARPVPRTVVEGMPGDRLTARVTMDAGSLTNYALGARFRLKEDNEPERMTIGTEWTIPDVVPQTDAEGRPFLGLVIRGPKQTDEKPLKLYPIGRTIHLMVFHTVSSEFPPFGPMFQIKKPKPTDPTHHFLAYYKICEPTSNGPVPEAAEAALVGVEGDIVTPEGGEVPSMTCPQAQARLEPEV